MPEEQSRPELPAELIKQDRDQLAAQVSAGLQLLRTAVKDAGLPALDQQVYDRMLSGYQQDIAAASSSTDYATAHGALQSLAEHIKAAIQEL
ncbi:MAG TPA: hypothetical protein VLI05_07105 [Candidatus Saccharimonadia bacterium]|nr:hypothetical protein [Candidatus Saccharimonadia bacterium]